MRCLNCGTEYTGSFCPACGQKAATQRLTIPQLIRQFIEGITNTDKGLIYTLIGLAKKPGSFLRNYIEGKRYNVYNPFQFVFLCVIVWVLADHWIGYRVESEEIAETLRDNPGFNYGTQIGKFLRQYTKWFTLLLVPVSGFIRSLFYKKYNVAEHIVIACYVLGGTFLALAILAWCMPPAVLLNPVFYIISGILYFSVYKPFRPKVELVLVELVSVLLTVILYMILVTIIVSTLSAIFPGILSSD